MAKQNCVNSIPIPMLLIDLLNQHNIEIDKLLMRLELKSIHQLSANLSNSQVLELLSFLTEATESPQPGLILGGALPGPVIYTAMNSVTAGEAVEILMKYSRLELLTIGSTEFYEIGNRAKIQLSLHTLVPQYDYFVADIAFSSLMYILKYGLEEAVLPEEVRFTSPTPINQRLYEETFQCPIVFGSHTNEFIFAKNLLNLKFNSADLVLGRFMREVCDSRLRKFSDPLPFSRLVLEAIQTIFKSKSPTMEGVSEQLKIPIRTLRRKLADEGASYREILDQYRKRRALELLQDSEISIEDVAQQLGFSDPRGFYSAFKKWTGQTPGEYRSHS